MDNRRARLTGLGRGGLREAVSPSKKKAAPRALTPFEKWWPHLRGKVKRIVSVTFEDGSTIDGVDEDQLRGYLKCLDDRRLDAEVRKAFGMSAREVREFLRAWDSVEASERASKPRKAVKKNDLIKFKNRFEQEHDGIERGWIKAACIEYRITAKTLNKRMAE